MLTLTVLAILFLVASLLMALPWWALVRIGEHRRRHAAPTDQAAFYLASLVIPVLLIASFLFLTFGPWDADFCESLHQTCINHLRRLDLPLPLSLLLGLLALLIPLRFSLALRPRRWTSAAGPLSPELAAKWQCITERLTRLSGGRIPALLLIEQPEAVCLVRGGFSPRLVLSSHLLATLDEAELTAAIAHELAHLRRHDLLFGYLAAACHHLLFYLPISRYCYQRWREEREKACDDLAVQWTGERLALASALVKVARMIHHRPAVGMACHLVTPGGAFTRRIERLLSPEACGSSAAGYPWSLILAAAVLLPQLGRHYTAWHHELEQVSVFLLAGIGVIP